MIESAPFLTFVEVVTEQFASVGLSDRLPI